MKRIFITTILLVSMQLLFSQHTLRYVEKNRLLDEGKELYQQKKYSASYREFEQLLKISNITDATTIEEAEYYLACNAFELRQADALKKLDAYVKKYPYSPHIDRTNYLVGVLEYEKNSYKKALDYFSVVDENHLIYEERADFLFAKGYALLITDNVKNALSVFEKLEQENTPHLTTAKYYAGYCQYRIGEYDKALKNLLSIENNPQFEDIAPYYITQIYYTKKDFDKVEKRANILLKKYPNSKNNIELYRIIGEKAYTDGNYQKAIDNLNKYIKHNKKVLRKDVYYLGVSYYKTANYNSAIKYLSKVTTKEDEMSESAYLQLGNAYIAINDINNSKMAYQSALQTNYNSKVREEALYNYALTAYQSELGFGESVNAFENFIKEFPNSKKIDSAYDYMAKVFLTSNNYDKAYGSILKIKNPTKKLIQTKQYLEYKMGTDAFAEKNYSKANEYFTRALQTDFTGKYQSDIRYWRSETLYRIGDYEQATSDLIAYFSLANITNDLNYKDALYSLGYDYFAQKQYSQSLTWFLKYINVEKDKLSPKYFDAINRIGDVYYSSRNFSKAEEYYSISQDKSKAEGDYALYQSAFMEGLQKNYNQKISKLNKLLISYPNSQYCDDALYQIGRSYIMLNNNDKTIETYKKLIDSYPNSTFTPKSQLEIGLIYYNINNFENAVPQLKKVIEQYPTSEEANTALETLETISIQTNRVDNYIEYAEKTGRISQPNTVQRTDSIMFLAAEKLYITSNYLDAIKSLNSYLRRYCPNGKFCNTATYYLAESYLATKDSTKALDEYGKLIYSVGNDFSENALVKAANISFAQKKYDMALIYFQKLKNITEFGEKRELATLGEVKCNYLMGRNRETKKVCDTIINSKQISEEIKNNALLYRAKTFIDSNEPSNALKDLRMIKATERTELGSERSALLANTYLQLNMLDKAEKSVLEFAKKGTPHQYWLAKSFITLADVYILKGDDFQAKQYLLSLQKNYTNKDEIQSMITKRVNEIEVRSKENIVE